MQQDWFKETLVPTGSANAEKIRPYLNDQREISESEFIDAFGMLKLREQYKVYLYHRRGVKYKCVIALIVISKFR